MLSHRMQRIAAAICLAFLSASALPKTDLHLGFNLNVGPPPPVVEVAPPPRPGLVWVPGYWVWDGHRHVWRRGHWMHERPGWAWEPAHWEERGGRWFFVAGHWERA
jgi:hypothetical protein